MTQGPDKPRDPSELQGKETEATAIKDALRRAYDPVLEEPIPEHLIATVRPPAAVPDETSEEKSKAPAPSPESSAPDASPHTPSEPASGRKPR